MTILKREEGTTADYILEIVAPIFNRKGYVGTSLSDITEATQLTKGAIYCNFKNKEELALHAFHKNVDFVIHPMTQFIKEQHNAIDKLLAITHFYRNYYELASSRGGCPVLNVGIDAKHVNPILYQATKEVVNRLITSLETIIEKGIQFGQLKIDINAKLVAGNIYAIIEGGIYLAMLHDDATYLHNVLDITEQQIIQLKRV